MGRGATNATPMFGDPAGTQYAENGGLGDIDLAGFIFEPYNDGQYIVKTTAFKAFDLPGFNQVEMGNVLMSGSMAAGTMEQMGDMSGAAVSVLVDGLTEDGFLADTKVFGSVAWSKTHPKNGLNSAGMEYDMLGSTESETGTSFWVGTQLPVMEKGKLGLEYNHGSQYWRPFSYGEDTMIGPKTAVRGNAYEAYFTYQLTEALSAQIRYTKLDYEYTGSNAFFGTDGTPMKIDTVKENAAWGEQYLADNPGADPETDPMAAQAYQAITMADNVVEAAQDLRFYIRYRF
jgi:hypothetical protein